MSQDGSLGNINTIDNTNLTTTGTPVSPHCRQLARGVICGCCCFGYLVARVVQICSTTSADAPSSSLASYLSWIGPELCLFWCVEIFVVNAGFSPRKTFMMFTPILSMSFCLIAIVILASGNVGPVPFCGTNNVTTAYSSLFSVEKDGLQQCDNKIRFKPSAHPRDNETCSMIDLPSFCPQAREAGNYAALRSGVSLDDLRYVSGFTQILQQLKGNVDLGKRGQDNALKSMKDALKSTLSGKCTPDNQHWPPGAMEMFINVTTSSLCNALVKECTPEGIPMNACMQDHCDAHEAFYYPILGACSKTRASQELCC